MASRRTWVMPVAILAVAAVLLVWGSRGDAQRSQEVHRFVLGLCEDLAGDRDPIPRLVATDPIISRPLISRLEAAVSGPRGLDDLTVEVVCGDRAKSMDLRPQATHTAILSAGGKVVLELRLIHHGEGQPIVIIGFSTPPDRGAVSIAP